MKVRSGFVSNSSSSSFILFFPKKIKTKKILSDLLLPEYLDNDVVIDASEYFESNPILKKDIIDHTFRNLHFIDEDYAKENVDSILNYSDISDYDNCAFIEYWKTLNLIMPYMALHLIEENKRSHPNSYCYHIELGNEHGYIAGELENSDIFKDFDPVIKSHH